MKITKKHLKRMILKEFDVINADSGEISEFAPSLEAALDIMRRLKIAPTKEDGIPHGEEAWLSDEDWQKYYKETEGKRWTRGRKKESDRLDIENLLPRLDQVIADLGGAGGDAIEATHIVKGSFKPDEWERLDWHFDREADYAYELEDEAITDYIAGIIPEGKIRIRKTDLARMIREVTDDISDEQRHEQSLFDDDQKRAAEEGYELNFIDWAAVLINAIRAIGEKHGQKRDERVGQRVIDLFGFYDDPVEEEHMENLPRDISFYDEWRKGKGSKASAWREAELTFADMFLAEGKQMRLKKSDLKKIIKEEMDSVTGIDDELVATLQKAHPGRDVIEDADVLEKIMNKHKPADMSVDDFLFNAMVANIIYEEHRSWFERELDPAVKSKQDAMKAAENVLRDEFKQKYGEDLWYLHMWIYTEHDDAEGVHAAKLGSHKWLQAHRRKGEGVSFPRKSWGKDPMWVVPGSKALPGTRDKPMHDVFSDKTFKANRAMDSSGKVVDAYEYKRQKIEEKYQEMQGGTKAEGRVIRVKKGDLQKAVNLLFEV